MKHLIKIESTPHGVLGVRHTGLDNQYCEAGELVILKWQPDAKWGLQEAHYTDDGGNVTAIDLTRVKVDGKDVVVFTMPNANITIGGTFNRFVIEDWTGRDAAFSIVGSFDVANLPTLDGFNDAGKVAFVKDIRKYATWDGYGWTYMDGTPVTPRYLTFTANEDGSSVGFCCWSEDYKPVDMGKNMQYSTDGGKTWEDYTIGVGKDNLVAIELDEGESVMFRGNNENLAYYLKDEDDYIYTKCFIGGSIAASGDVTSLLNGVGGVTTLASNCYTSMFQGCTSLTQAPILPATTLAEYCYNSMFYGCTSLTQAPALPATTLASSCYNSMFYGCTSLTQAPALPATTLASRCYQSMFNGCTSLTQAPALPATTLAEYCYYYMFSGCISLTQAPTLPATTLASNCYDSMFKDCTSLTQAPALPATTLASSCYQSMFNGCTSLTQAPALPATTLASSCYDSIFQGCTSLTQAPALPATTLASSCYQSMFQGCTSLTQAPALPATTLASSCYQSMFQGCTSLTQAPILPATTLASNCYNSMFKGCTSLTQAPALPATTLASSCYQSMFNGCTSLTQAPALPATTLASSCYQSMFNGCTGITSHDVATLNNSVNTFKNNSSCALLTIHADVPPTIANNTITGLKADCAIYVPDASVDAYKAAQYWSARAAYIQAIP